MTSASSRAWPAGTMATSLLGSAAANRGLASVPCRTHSQLFAKRLGSSPISSRSHRSTSGTPRSWGKITASGPSRSQITLRPCQAMRDSRCEPAHRSELVRAWAMKSCTGPKLIDSNAGLAPLSAANAEAKAAERSRWVQMVWSGMRVSAGSCCHRARRPSASISGPKRQKERALRRASGWPSASRSMRPLKWSTEAALMCAGSMSSLPRGYSVPESGWIRTGVSVKRTWVQAA